MYSLSKSYISILLFNNSKYLFSNSKAIANGSISLKYETKSSMFKNSLSLFDSTLTKNFSNPLILANSSLYLSVYFLKDNK